MENNEQIPEETIPTEEATEQEAQAETETTPTESEEAAAESEEKGTETDEGQTEPATEETFSLRYKHEDVSVTKGEAIRLAQMGKHYEENVKGIIDDLDYFATLQGKSVKELVADLVNGVEEKQRRELVDQFGADNPLVEEMMELRRGKNRKAYEDAVTERQTREKQAEEEAEKSANTKLAEQFESLREIFPELDTVDKIPDTVLKRAIQSGDLEKEMLRYEKSERNKIEAAKASEEKNKKSNVGSAQSVDAESGTISAFMSGLWG